MKLRALAIVAALALPTIALADPPAKAPADQTMTPDKTAKPSDGTAKLSADDTKIVAHLHHVNQMEIDLGKAAQQKSTAAGVKSYGQSLVDDHQSADKDLTAFAKKHSLATVPAEKPMTDADRQDDKDMTTQVIHLKTLKGAEFDKEFLNMMATGHDKELAKIDVSIGAATDPDLQTMLKSIKPVLQRHADQARDLQKSSPQASADQPGTKLPSSR
jgi:putative membrane protein